MTLEPIVAAALPPRIRELAERIAARGGRALAVGGWVRDRLLGADPADLDLEVHGLSAAELDDMLAEFGPVHLIGRSFAIRRVRGLAADLSWVEPPAGSAPLQDDDLESHFARAARRRDLTINAMGFDPLTGRLFDPASGRDDLESRRLRFVDEARFGDDPLRAFRVAQLAARLEMTPDDALIAICTRQDLAGMAGERLMNEWTSLLMLARRPSVALDWLERMDQLRAFPEIDSLRGVRQDARWHPEGDVFIHTRMTLDAAAALRDASEAPLALMFAALCHDFGKPSTTQIEAGDDKQSGEAIMESKDEPAERIRSIRHEHAGIAPTRSFMRRLQPPKRLLGQVEVLVDRHLAPVQFVNQNAGDKAYRRLVRKLDRAHVKPQLLADLARADHLGRTTEDARLGRFAEGDAFLERIGLLGLRDGPRPAVVQGRHLQARGYSPGPEYGEILERCLALQDATGLDDPGELLSRALGSKAQE